MSQIQNRELSANDYDMLLKLDEHRNKCSDKDITKWRFWEAKNNEEEKENPLEELNCEILIFT